MLTLAMILMATKQMVSYGEGLEGARQDNDIHRDHGSTERKLGTGPDPVGGESRFTTDTARGLQRKQPDPKDQGMKAGSGQ